MAKRYRLKELERDRGDLHRLIVPLVNEGGQAHAARSLGVTQTTISNWLHKEGYRPKTVYERIGAQNS